MCCFIASVTASKAGRSSGAPSSQSRSSPAKSTYKSGTTKRYRPNRKVIIPENWYDKVSDSEKSLAGPREYPSVAVKALRARQFFRRISAFRTDDKGVILEGPIDWELHKLQFSLLYIMDDLYEEREREKEYPTEWEDKATYILFIEKTVSSWVEDLPNDEKACVEGLADILVEALTLDFYDEAGWEEHEGRVGEYLHSIDPIPKDDQGLEELDLLED
ncbi:hypothetical protein FPRO04_13442 [Fusarium proliferatum]|nr:hypothetical protein FPRO03_10575 [Fusarium proliferatum]KAG4282154.1 hypothetical protein FPRO04_13442 [Fusarium proliferatum]